MPVNIGLIRGWGNHTVNATFQKAVGEELEGIGDVDRDAPRVWFDVFPFTLGRSNLQCRYRLPGCQSSALETSSVDENSLPE